MGPQEGCCLGLYQRAINDSSKSGKVSGRAYQEGRMSGGVATCDKEEWHCVSKIEYSSLITESKTSPLGRDLMGSTWKVNQRPRVPNPGESENVETIFETTRVQTIGSLEAARMLSAVPWRGRGQSLESCQKAGGRSCGRRMDQHPLRHSLPGSPGQQPGPEAPGRPAPQWDRGRRNPAFDDPEAFGPPGTPSLAVPAGAPSPAAPLPAAPSFPSGNPAG